MEKLEIKRLSFGSLFKILFIGMLLPIFLFGLACGIAALFGANTVTINNVNVYGIQGLLAGMVIGLILPAIFALLFSLILSIGLWVYSLFKPIVISYKEK